MADGAVRSRAKRDAPSPIETWGHPGMAAETRVQGLHPITQNSGVWA